MWRLRNCGNYGKVDNYHNWRRKLRRPKIGNTGIRKICERDNLYWATSVACGLIPYFGIRFISLLWDFEETAGVYAWDWIIRHLFITVVFLGSCLNESIQPLLPASLRDVSGTNWFSFLRVYKSAPPRNSYSFPGTPHRRLCFITRDFQVGCRGC